METERRAYQRRDGEASQETQNAVTGKEIEGLHREINELRKQVESLQSDRNKALIWGVLALGTLVLGMGTWIVNLFSIKGH